MWSAWRALLPWFSELNQDNINQFPVKGTVKLRTTYPGYSHSQCLYAFLLVLKNQNAISNNIWLTDKNSEILHVGQMRKHKSVYGVLAKDNEKKIKSTPFKFLYHPFYYKQKSSNETGKLK